MNHKHLLNEKNFIKLVIVGLLLSVLAALSFNALSIFYVPIESLKSAISLVSLAYITFILKESHLKAGRVSTLFLQSILQLILLLSMTSLNVIIGSNLLAIWLVRTFYLHRNLVDSVLDIGFLIAGIVASIWAFNESRSLLLGFWTFFLVQSLMAFISIFSSYFKGNDSSQKTTDYEKTDTVRTSLNLNQSHFEQAFEKAKRCLKETRERNEIAH